MLTKNWLGRARTIALTIVAISGLVGMTLQPALARTPDVSRPAAAVADLDIGALISQLRAFILSLQAQIDELEEANEAPPAAEVDEDEDEVEVEVEDENEDVDDDTDEDVEENDDHDDDDDEDESEDDDESDDDESEDDDESDDDESDEDDD